MLLLIPLLSVALATSGVVGVIETALVKVYKVCYYVNHLYDIEAPFRDNVVISQINILRSINTMFFSFEPEITDAEYFKVGFFNLGNSSKATIVSSGNKRVVNFSTFDIDQEKNLVYLGGCDGVYVLNVTDNNISPYSSRGDKILSVFVKGNVSYVRDDEYEIVKKVGENFEILLDSKKAEKFVITPDDVIVFIHGPNLYVSKNKEVILVSSNIFFRGLVIDLNGTVYTWWVDGIYKVTIEQVLAKSNVTRVANIPNIGAMTFNKENNIMFTAGRKLFLLTPINSNSC